MGAATEAAYKYRQDMNNMHKIVKAEFTPGEQKNLTPAIDAFIEFFFENAVLDISTCSVRISRQKIFELLAAIASLNKLEYVGDKKLDIQMTITRGLQALEQTKILFRIGPPINPMKNEQLSILEYLRSISEYAKVAFDIREDSDSSSVYKFKTAYQNIKDMVIIMAATGADQKFLDLCSRCMSFLALVSNVSFSLNSEKRLRRSLRKDRSSVEALFL